MNKQSVDTSGRNSDILVEYLTKEHKGFDGVVQVYGVEVWCDFFPKLQSVLTAVDGVHEVRVRALFNRNKAIVIIDKRYDRELVALNIISAIAGEITGCDKVKVALQDVHKPYEYENFTIEGEKELCGLDVLVTTGLKNEE
jgi:hypothetical protein